MTETPLIDPASTQDIKPGAIFEVVHPFIRDGVSSLFDETEGKSVTVESWRPGTRMEFVLPGGTQYVADDEGFQILEVVSLHKPGKYPTRVFYLRRWRDPSGHEFGKGELRCKSLSAFRGLIGGYRWPYEIEKNTAIAAE